MRVSTLLLLQIVFRRLGRRAKSYFIIIIVDDDDDDDEKRGQKLCKICVKRFSSLFKNIIENAHERGGHNRKRGI